jgi:hypothetical protein
MLSTNISTKTVGLLILTYLSCIQLVNAKIAKSNVIQLNIRSKFHSIYSFPLAPSEIRASAITSSLNVLTSFGPFRLNKHAKNKSDKLTYNIYYNKKNSKAHINLTLKSKKYKKQKSDVHFSLAKLSQDEIFNKLDKMGKVLSQKFLDNFDTQIIVKKVKKEEVFKVLSRPKAILTAEEVEFLDKKRKMERIEEQEYYQSYIRNIESDMISYFASKMKIPTLEILKSHSPALFKRNSIINYKTNSELRNYTFNVINKEKIIVASVSGNIMDQEESLISFKD